MRAIYSKKGEPFSLGNACSGLPDSDIEELKKIAKLYYDSSGVVIKLSGLLGSTAERLLKLIPKNIPLDKIADLALRSSYWAASTTQSDEKNNNTLNSAFAWAEGEDWHKYASMVSGVAGGFGGVGFLAADLVATTTLTMRSIQQIAVSYGEDISNEDVRLDCLKIFGFGGPLSDDDEVDTGLYAARLASSGKGLNELLSRIVPKFVEKLGTNGLSKVIPVIGAVFGAVLNPAFVEYYQKMAHVHFRLRRIEAIHDPEQVQACFERIMKSYKSRNRK